MNMDGIPNLFIEAVVNGVAPERSEIFSVKVICEINAFTSVFFIFIIVPKNDSFINPLGTELNVHKSYISGVCLYN